MDVKKKRIAIVLVVLLAVLVCGIVVFAIVKEKQGDSEGTAIVYDKDGITCDSGDVLISGTRAVIKKEGSYSISGECDNAAIEIAAGDKETVHIILSGAVLSNSEEPVISQTSGEKVVMTIADNSDNKLQGLADTYNNSSSDISDNSDSSNDSDGESSDSGTYAVIKTEGSMSVNGNGNLSIYSKSGNGIRTKDDFSLVSGNITIDAANNGIVGHDNVVIEGGNVNITSGNDAIKSNNDNGDDKGNVLVEGGELKLTATGDGIQAINGLKVTEGNITVNAAKKGIRANGNLVIDKGVINIEKSAEGIEAQYITINGGTIDIISSDDGINASDRSTNTTTDVNANERHKMMTSSDALLTINGGKVSVNASGDGLDSNGDIVINGGEIYVDGPENSGNGALDSGDNNNKITVSGGTLLAIGSSGMAEFPDSESTLYTLGATLDSQAANSKLTISDEEGNTVLDYTSKKKFSYVCFSSPKLEKDKSYSISVNDVSMCTITISDKLSTDGNTNTNGGFRNRHGMDGEFMPQSPDMKEQDESQSI